MAETRITTTAPSGLRRLGLHGQLAVSMHRQLATILGNRLGPAHARYLARPVLTPDGGPIDWYAPVPGPVRPLAALPADLAKQIAARAGQIESDIAQLAAKLKAEGQSAELVGRMLELALVTPGGSSRAHLYEAGGAPVLVLWAHEAEGAAGFADGTAPPARSASEPAAVAAAAAPNRAQGAPPPADRSPSSAERPTPTEADAAQQALPRAEAGALGAVGGPTPRRGLLGWLMWLLPVLLTLLLIVLLLRACEPLPPVVVEVPGPVQQKADNGDALARLESEEQTLRAKLAELNRTRMADLALCRPVPPPEPVIPPVVPPKAEVVPPPPALPEPPRIEAKPPEPKLAEPKLAEPKLAEPKLEPKPIEPKPAPKPAETAPPKPKAQAALPPPAPPTEAKPKSCNPTYPPGEEPEVVMIVDGSGSMDERYLGPQSRMDLARRSIEHIVKGLPKPVDVALVEFTTCTDVRRDKFYSAPERGDLIAEVNRLRPTGGTPLARSLERAGNIISGDADGTIVVVSDGDDTCHGDPCAVARAIKARKPRVTINVVDLSGESGRAVVQCIAKATGGKVLSPNSGADMLQKMQQATRQPDVRQCGP
ncbi:VWA domain-containing protein [Azospirillum sp. B506]|uniref:VWA domain-containing protein n=1 Tax=Azospirillum sp. B506 TaxID=137721 RepID=UPI0003487A08|nr:VWA domain-containing protein [Azospirillum sp. B506]